MLGLVGAVMALGVAAPVTVERAECPDHGVRPAAGSAGERGKANAMARRLADLPPADHVLTVFRTVDRCPVPVIVRRDIGGR